MLHFEIGKFNYHEHRLHINSSFETLKLGTFPYCDFLTIYNDFEKEFNGCLSCSHLKNRKNKVS